MLSLWCRDGKCAHCGHDGVAAFVMSKGPSAQLEKDSIYLCPKCAAWLIARLQYYLGTDARKKKRTAKSATSGA